MSVKWSVPEGRRGLMVTADLVHAVAQIWPWGWCVVDSTPPTFLLTMNVGGVEFTTRTMGAASIPDGLPAPTTKQPNGPVLAVPAGRWSAFLRGVATGELDR